MQLFIIDQEDSLYLSGHTKHTIWMPQHLIRNLENVTLLANRTVAKNMFLQVATQIQNKNTVFLLLKNGRFVSVFLLWEFKRIEWTTASPICSTCFIWKTMDNIEPFCKEKLHIEKCRSFRGRPDSDQCCRERLNKSWKGVLYVENDLSIGMHNVLPQELLWSCTWVTQLENGSFITV